MILEYSPTNSCTFLLLGGLGGPIESLTPCLPLYNENKFGKLEVG